jgi:hypothetical protein
MGQIQPGTMDELMPVYGAAAHQQQGLKGFMSTRLLIDRAANKWMVVTLFETLANLEASERVPRQAMADPRAAVPWPGRRSSGRMRWPRGGSGQRTCRQTRRRVCGPEPAGETAAAGRALEDSWERICAQT